MKLGNSDSLLFWSLLFFAFSANSQMQPENNYQIKNEFVDYINSKGLNPQCDPDFSTRLLELDLRPSPEYISPNEDSVEYIESAYPQSSSLALGQALSEAIDARAIMNTWNANLSRSAVAFWEKFDQNTDYTDERNEYSYWLYRREAWNSARDSMTNAPDRLTVDGNRMSKIFSMFLGSGNAFSML